ncbi:MAG: phosphodiester glycosidase family protein [Clostridiales bacterium]|nr:phosphodiester glycosidase family protein [Clostridiales bacterium]
MNRRTGKRFTALLAVLMIMAAGIGSAAADVVPLGMDMTVHGATPDPNGWNQDYTEYEDESIHAVLYQEAVWASGKGKTVCHWAEIEIKDPSQLRTTLTNETYYDMIDGKSEVMFKDINAICAINDDYVKSTKYRGYVMRQGVFYADTLDDFEGGKNQDVLIIDDQGDFSTVIRASSADMQAHLEEMARQGRTPVNVITFGPTLIVDGEALELRYEDSIHSVHVPCARSAIAQIGPLKYVIVAIDGAASEETGMKAFEVANFILSKYPDCKIAYNLDGGGSSKLHFGKKLINKAPGRRMISGLIYFASAAAEKEGQE